MKTCSFITLFAITAGVAACLPRYEDAPLTVTGEAPVGWSPPAGSVLGGADGGASGDAGAAAGTPSKCAGTVPDLATAAKNRSYPCSITNLDLTTSTAGQSLGYAALVTTVYNLRISNATQMASLKQIKQIGNFNAENFNDATLYLADHVVITEAIAIYGKLQNITGFLGVSQLTSQLVIANSPNLTKISGFTNLVKVGAIEIRGVPKLVSLAAFSKLNQIQSSTMSDVQSGSVALPVLPATTINHVSIQNFGGISQLNLFYNATQISFMTFQQMPNLARVDIPKLATVSGFTLIDIGKMVNLDSFGPSVQVYGGLTVCGTPMTGATLEAWRKAHATNLQFSKCPNGCTGGECP